MARARLVKVLVRIPNHWFLPAESMWARRVRPGEYELRNVPFFAYDLNFGDVVRACAPDRESLPEVTKVVRRSGNRTFRVIFPKGAPRKRIFAALKPMSVTFELFDERYAALNVADPKRYDEVEQYLRARKREKKIDYESCEARVRGSFDAKKRKR